MSKKQNQLLLVCHYVNTLGRWDSWGDRFDIFYLRVKWSTKCTEGSLNFGGGGKKISEKFLSLINLWPDLEQVTIGR